MAPGAGGARGAAAGRDPGGTGLRAGKLVEGPVEEVLDEGDICRRRRKARVSAA